jgi:hypothetical protein
MQGGGLGRVVVHRHLHQDVVDIGLGIFDLDIEIAVVVEHPGVDQLELGSSRPRRRLSSTSRA